MTNLINYLWEGAICLTLLWLFYKVFLEQNTFFAWNRAFLLCSLIVALIFPALSLTGISSLNLGNESFVVQLPQFEMNATNQGPSATSPISLSNLLLGVYLTGLLFTLSRFIVGIVSLLLKTRKAKVFHSGSYTILEHSSFEPSSFFHLIFLPEGALQLQQKVDWIIAHETTHADYRHSLDKLLIQFVKIIFWFYPIYRMYEQALEVLHEYQVDEKMTETYPLEEYARLLLNLAKPNHSSLLVHNFNQFQIKKRLTMMTQPKSKWMARGIYALALPLFACLFVLISCTPNEDMPQMDTQDGEEIVITEMIMKESVFDVVEDMPSPLGGMEGWNNYLSANLKYPQAARDAKVEGTVYLIFTVTDEGKIVNVSILRGIGAGLDEEALRVVRNSPDWIPGQQDGENVNVKMRLPIRFKLN
ncbi:M56 family metallopeptidase [uncultured Cyclobacterium sp.]|uniref:M56 family metallopeptidase n=1 Tax=uncultured Cyclobacterium sp. TaxID=453820 RepID=UPI0030EECEC1|tara:strand:+ start:24812 stop:26062 length:1251 start_codon:yes stop_codon:yes gene_type:complete